VNGIVAFRICWFARPVKKFATWPSMPRISFGPAFEKFWNRLLASAPDETKSTWTVSGFPDGSPKMWLSENVIVSVALASVGAVDGSEPTVRSFPRLAVSTIGFVIVPLGGVRSGVTSTADVPISPRLIRPSVVVCGSLSVRSTLPVNEIGDPIVIEPSRSERLILIVPAASVAVTPRLTVPPGTRKTEVGDAAGRPIAM
jgi:hypothetical protein